MGTEGGWLDGNTADGIRRTFADEFHLVHVLNLRDNQRTSGEQSRKEGGKVFGQGSRATVAITLLVKRPGVVSESGAEIHYHDIGDYLSREEKLKRVVAASIESLDWQRITSNAQADWLEQRSTVYSSLIPLADAPDAFFVMSSNGLKTNRDASFVFSCSDQIHRTNTTTSSWPDPQASASSAMRLLDVAGKSRHSSRLSSSSPFER